MGKLIRFRRQAKAEDEAARALFPPFYSAPTDARAASFASDAAAHEDTPRPGVTPDPELARRRIRKQRGAILALVLVFAGGTAAALFGDRGYLDVRRQRAQYRELRDAHAAHLQRVEALKREVDRLKADPSAVERIAREDLGFVEKDEITLLLPLDDPDEPGGLDARIGSGIVPAVKSTR